MPTYLLNDGLEIQKLDAKEKEIKSLIPDVTRIASVQDIEKQILRTQNQVFVLVLVPAADSEHFEKLIDRVTKYRGKMFFVLVSDELSATDYKRLVQTGGADWVSETAHPSEIVDIIARRTVKVDAEQRPTDPPLVASFAPSAGGVGNATLAIETAVLLKKGGAGKERKVCIVDLDFQTGHVCDYLDIDPQLKILDIAENPERLDNQLFEIFISRHSSGVHVFAAPRSKFQPWALDLTALDKLFGMIAARYEFILVALPVTWYPWTAHVLAASGGIVVTGINTIPGLRLISETLTAIRDAARDASEIRVVINHSEHGFLGRVARSDHVKKVLGEEKVLFVRDDKIAIEAVNTGAPMSVANPGAKIVKQIGALAQFCVGLKKASAPGR